MLNYQKNCGKNDVRNKFTLQANYSEDQMAGKLTFQ